MMIRNLTAIALLILCFCSAPLQAKPSTLYVALGSEPTSGFDPLLGWGKYGRPLIQSTLLQRTQHFELIGDLATHWQLSDNHKTWTVTLRDNVTFSNGEPLTAKDVAFTFLKAQQSLSVYDLSALENIEILNPTTLTFHLKQPDLTFTDHFLSLGIIPKDSDTSKYGQQPIGSGPYMLDNWLKGERITLVRNPAYYGTKPEFKKMVIVFGNEELRFNLLKTNQLQLSTLPQHLVKQLPKDLRLWPVTSVDNRGIVWPMQPKTPESHGNNVSASPAIRAAVDYAIDRELLVTALMEGFASPAQSIADGLPWGPSETTAISPTPDLKKAHAILANAGWRDSNQNGIIDRDGQEATMTLYYKAGDTTRQHLALTVSQMVKPLGIQLSVVGTDWNTIATKMADNPVVMGFGSLSANDMRYVYHSEFAGVDFYNSGRYSNPLVDKAIEQAIAAPSWEQSQPLWQKIHRILAQDRPWTWLINQQHLYATSPCLDLGQPMTEPHDHGWPITANVEQWRWICE